MRTFFCAGVPAAQAATITVGPHDCSASAVNTAISKSNAGDTIQLTCTGTVNWNTQVNLNGGKTLKGPGNKFPNPSNSGTWPLIINSTASDAIISITNAANQDVNRVTGLKFQGGSNASLGIYVHGSGTGKDGNGAIDTGFPEDTNHNRDLDFSIKPTLWQLKLMTGLLPGGKR